MLNSYVDNLTAAELKSYAIAAFKHDNGYYTQRIILDWETQLKELDPKNESELQQLCWETIEPYHDDNVYYDEEGKRITDEIDWDNLTDDEIDLLHETKSYVMKIDDESWEIDWESSYVIETMTQLIMVDYVKTQRPSMIEQKVKGAIENSQLTIADEIKSRRFELFAAKKPHSYFDAVVDFERTNGLNAYEYGFGVNSTDLGRLIKLIETRNDFELTDVKFTKSNITFNIIDFGKNHNLSFYLYNNAKIKEMREEREYADEMYLELEMQYEDEI
jgi:hypothetical protein